MFLIAKITYSGKIMYLTNRIYVCIMVLATLERAFETEMKANGLQRKNT